MSTVFALRLATYVLVYDGLLALFSSGLVGPVGIAVATAAVTAGWWADGIVARLRWLREGSALMLLVAAGISLIDLVYLAGSTLTAMVRFLVFLVVYSLFVRRESTQLREVGLLAFFMVVAAAPLSFGVGFLFMFLVFVVVGTWMLMLHHVVSESARGPVLITGRAAPSDLGRDLLRLSVAASIVTLAVTTAFFFVTPRVGQATLPLRAPAGRMVSGFADRVELGAFGQIEADAAVVMRVHIGPATPAPERLSGLRWRGIAFDHFDGRAWTVGPGRRTAGRRSALGEFDISPFRGRGPVVSQEIDLEPIASDVIFGAPRILRVSVRAETVTVDDMGTVSVPAATARLHYVVHSQLDAAGAPGADVDEALEDGDPLATSRYLQLPPLPARIGELARTVSAGAAGPYEVARRLTEHFSDFQYTTTLERRTSLDPLEEFLFVGRAGNCEYFAAALTVMLRSVGIPARVVNGFQRGEWNPYGRYYVVRLRDAHSWVEAYVRGRGWTTFDPSPRTEAAGGGWRRSLYLDALRWRWHRYVMSWDLRDQLEVALSIQRAASSLRRDGRALPGWSEAGPLGLGVVVAAGAAFGYRRWRRRPAGRVVVSRLPVFYARALRELRRRGFTPAPGETAREFRGRVAAAAPECGAALGRLTDAYELSRFGSVTLTPDQLAELRSAARALAPRGRVR